MKSKLAFLILAVSVISVTQICYAGQTKPVPSIQACKATVLGQVIEKKEETRDSTTSGKLRCGGTVVSGNDTDD